MHPPICESSEDPYLWTCVGGKSQKDTFELFFMSHQWVWSHTWNWCKQQNKQQESRKPAREAKGDAVQSVSQPARDVELKQSSLSARIASAADLRAVWAADASPISTVSEDYGV